MTYEFNDVNGQKVELIFNKDAFSIKPQHVLVLCRYQDHWLLTNHSVRGLEFPGGKVEQGETIEEAGLREVFEETGGKAHRVIYLGEYLVKDQIKPFVKAILFVKIHCLAKREHYFETGGPVLIDDSLANRLTEEQFSFIMKDRVVPLALLKAKEKKLY